MRQFDESEESSDTEGRSGTYEGSDSEENEQSEIGVFDLIVHHSGVLGECAYFEGKQFLVGDIYGRRLTMHMLDKLLARNGIRGLCRYHWREHKTPYYKGLNTLQFKEDVEKMARAGSRYGSVHLYIEHIGKEEILKIVNDIKAAQKPPPKRTLVLEELEDDTPVQPRQRIRAKGNFVRNGLAICGPEDDVVGLRSQVPICRDDVVNESASMNDRVEQMVEELNSEELVSNDRVVTETEGTSMNAPENERVECEEEMAEQENSGIGGSSGGVVNETEGTSMNVTENERVESQEEMAEQLNSGISGSSGGVVNESEGNAMHAPENETDEVDETIEVEEYMVEGLNNDGIGNENWGFDSINGWRSANIDLSLEDMNNMRLNDNWDFVFANDRNEETCEETSEPGETSEKEIGESSQPHHAVEEDADDIHGNGNEDIQRTSSKDQVQVDDDDLYDDEYSVEVGDEDFNANIESPLKKKKFGRPRKMDDANVTEEAQNLEIHVESQSSDYLDSDELLTESDDELGERGKRYHSFNAKRQLGKGDFTLGMLFKNVEEFKKAVREYGIRSRWQIKLPKNCKDKVQVKCAQDCGYYIFASKLHPKDQFDPTFQIKSGCFEHKFKKVHNNNHCTSSWLARKYLEDFRVNPAWQLKHLIAKVASDWQYNIKYMKAWRAKDRALKMIHGDERSQYEKLLDYRLELLRTNPGSTIMLKRNEGVFQGIYICLEPLRRGFLAHCRPLVCLDGCFLKTNYGGQLLCAVGIDPNDCIFPIAYAVCDVENKENWEWFLQLLGDDLALEKDSEFCFMSDKQKGLVHGIATLFPKAEHRMCVRHLYTNYREQFKGKELKDLLWDCARASYPARLERCLNVLQERCPEARQWLKARPTKNWSRASFTTFPKCDMLTNNLCESFNKYILDAREKPILIMLEMIRTKLMKRLASKRKVMDNVKDVFCPKIRAKIAENTNQAHLFIPTFCGGSKYQVEGSGGLQYVVDLAQKTCGCRGWDLTAIPCSHAIACILDNNEDPDNYTDKQYLVSNYLQLYTHYIKPVNMMEMWPKEKKSPAVIPPADPPKKKGKKKKARRKHPEEFDKGKENATSQPISGSEAPSGGQCESGKLSRKGNVKMKCTVCGQIGHNKRSHTRKDTTNSTEQGNGKSKSTNTDGKKKRKAATANGERKNEASKRKRGKNKGVDAAA